MKYNTFFLLGILLFIPMLVHSQMRMANTYYNNYAYQKAIKKYHKVLSRKPNQPEALFYLANSYRLIGKTHKAEQWFAKAVLYNPEPKSKLFYAQMLLINGSYKNAAEWFKRYAAVAAALNDRTDAEQMAEYATNLAEEGIHHKNYTIQPVTFNSEKLDFSPMLLSDDQLVFASNRDTKRKNKQKTDPWTWDNFVDLYLVTKDASGNFAEPILLPKTINSVYHEGPSSYHAKSSTLYFTRSDYVEKKRGFDDKNNTRLKIYFVSRNGENWGELNDLPFNSSGYSTCHPAISADGDMLVFASDRPGGFGGMDLYISRRIDEKWTQPVNLGDTINTAGNDLFPYLDKHNNLYFASDMHIGIGGLDIFEARYDGTTWKQPSNLGSPVNSAKDDFGITFQSDLQGGYFTSNRKDEMDDIYRFNAEIEEAEYMQNQVYSDLKKNKDLIYVCGKVINKKYGNPLKKAEVTLYNQCSGENVTVFTNERGEFTFPVPEECDYAVLAHKQNFNDNGVRFTTIDTTFSTECIEITIPLDFIESMIPDLLTSDIEIKEGMVIELYHVYFDFDKYNIRPDAVPDLNVLLELLQKHPSMRGELMAHTDCRGTKKYNEWLAQQRANSALEYLVKRGIDRKRLKAKGYGEYRLKNHCSDGVDCTKLEHQRNRRVEFKVTHFDKTISSKEPKYFQK